MNTPIEPATPARRSGNSFPPGRRQARNQRRTARRLVSIECSRFPVDNDLRIAFGDKAGLMARDRTDTRITAPGDRPPHHFADRAAGHDLTAVARCVADSNDSAHACSLF
ncbi:UNVERIFIED_ORG: hypothetical protein J2811_004437 [Burkholderia cepacia]|nr:hypothetical protein [Burkholderia cepacia]MDP9597011.1 hypothetical protein [Burkholderia cepacia]MDP9624981.1 hypothetical protein [Burkholderia cepacia]MDP9671066.1 hypothetical protein [Burkholderia cepacia]MDP9718289.1 hypothetical protein [Burkholderia cepacia]